MRPLPKESIMMKTKTICAAVALALGSIVLVAYAAERIVGQKDKQFTIKALKIKAGEAVDFRNDDSFFHNVFSLSDAKSFDLGSFPQGQSRRVVFDKPGIVDVECSIHPDMKMTITVEK
jgi:plastocyanin